jgi:hypothetical protein
MFGLLHFLPLLAAALPQQQNGPPNGGFHGPANGHVQRAAYFLENNPAGNNLVSLHIAEDGSLSNPQRTSTGGYGSISLNSSDLPFLVDSLGSQGSVTVVEDLLFTVNAGSNTISLFTIPPEDPYHPRLVGSPVDTLGQFPISVTYSAQIQKACVLNGGAVAGVACFSVNPDFGLQADGGLRELSTPIIAETTPPHGPPGSAAQVLFIPDSSAVFATVKGTPGPPVKAGSILAWPVQNGQVSSSAPVVSQFSNVVLDFGFLFTDSHTIFMSDPSFGAALLHVNEDLTVKQEVHTIIPGQQAICWTQYWPSGSTLYAIDAGLNQIWTLNAGSGALEGSINITMTDGMAAKGVFDSFIAGDLLYSLTGANGIAVTDLAKQKQLQFLDLSSFGERQHYQGFALSSQGGQGWH